MRTLQHFNHLVLLLMLFGNGCERDNSNSVTLVIDGDPSIVRDLATEVFRGLVDTPERYSFSSWRFFDGPVTVRIAPVNNVERLSDKLSFATITNQTNSTLHLTLDTQKAKQIVTFSRVERYIREFPTYVSWHLFHLRCRLAVWLSGESVSNVMWNELFTER